MPCKYAVESGDAIESLSNLSEGVKDRREADSSVSPRGSDDDDGGGGGGGGGGATVKSSSRDMID
jgi:hypothetical protein